MRYQYVATFSVGFDLYVRSSQIRDGWLMLRYLGFIGTLGLVLCAPVAQAVGIYDENPTFCEAYAVKAVSQYQTAQAARCPTAGLRWNDDVAGQQRWCETVSEAVAQAETEARAETLLQCFGGGVVNAADLILTPNALGEEMIRVVREAGLPRVQQVLAAGADLDYEGMQGNDGKILFVAMGVEKLPIVAFFIGLGLDPNGTFNGGYSPIGMITGNHELLEYVLNHGGDANNTGELYEFAQLPLVKAIASKDVKAVQILIKHGARVQVDELMDECSTLTLLDYAIKQGTPAIVAALRQVGAKTYAECAV